MSKQEKHAKSVDKTRLKGKERSMAIQQHIEENAERVYANRKTIGNVNRAISRVKRKLKNQRRRAKHRAKA